MVTGMLSSHLMQSEIIISRLVRNCLELLDNIDIGFDSKLYRHIVGTPISINCAPLVADLFFFCCVRDFMLSLTEEN